MVCPANLMARIECSAMPSKHAHVLPQSPAAAAPFAATAAASRSTAAAPFTAAASRSAAGAAAAAAPTTAPRRCAAAPPSEVTALRRRRPGPAAHQDTNTLSVVCQPGDVDGLEMETGEGQWVLLHPSPTSLLVMVGNALRAWTNGRVRAPFHCITVGGDVTRYSAILFSVPGGYVRGPEELVDDEEDRRRRFRGYDYDEFVRFCVSEEGARHQDKLKAYCGV